MGGLSWWHWVIILSVFILLFGAKKLPDTARGLGRSMRILKSEVAAMNDDAVTNEQQGALDRPLPVDDRVTPLAQQDFAPRSA